MKQRVPPQGAELPQKIWLKPSQIAKLFSISTTTLALWANLGLIDVLKTKGNHRRYTKESVEAYLGREKAIISQLLAKAKRTKQT